MFGNKTGWMFAAVIAVVMGGLLWFVARPPATTPPIHPTVLTIAHEMMQLPVPPTTVVPAGVEECDAGALYRQAIEDYRLTSVPYERFKNHPMDVQPSQMPAIDDIVKATHCKNFTLFKKTPAEIVNYSNDEPSLHALDEVGNICCTLGKLYMNEKYANPTNPQEARKLWEGAFQLGARLFQERLTWAEWQNGHDLMQTAAQNLSEQASKDGDTARAKEIENFIRAEGEYALKISEAFKIVGGIDENFGGRYAGDIFAIAKDSGADPMWRVEAIKHLGHYKFNSQTKGDQLGAMKVLTRMSEEGDLPASVHTAAVAAHDLTLRQHNLVGGSVE